MMLNFISFLDIILLSDMLETFLILLFRILIFLTFTYGLLNTESGIILDISALSVTL